MRFGGAGPLGLFSDCHAQTLANCYRLRALAGSLADASCATRAREASREIIDHFNGAEIRHHGEEEACLYPALIESMAGSDAICLHEMTRALTVQHRALELRWYRLREQLEAVAAGEGASLDAQTVEAFIEANLEHIEREELELLPMAARLIVGTELPRLRTAVLELRRPAPAPSPAGS